MTSIYSIPPEDRAIRVRAAKKALRDRGMVFGTDGVVCCRRHWELTNHKKANGVDGVLWNPVGMPFIVCRICGNKRCPKATDCKLDCTNSNEPGQAGSIYA